MEKDSNLIVRVPLALRENFKDVAWSRRKTMSELLREYMESQVTQIKTE